MGMATMANINTCTLVLTLVGSATKKIINAQKSVFVLFDRSVAFATAQMPISPDLAIFFFLFTTTTTTELNLL